MLHTTATMPQFRLKLDVPHKFALSPGYLNAVHARNFRPDRGDADDAWQDANTGLWMLKPSFATVDYYRDNNWKQLTAWRHDPNLWQQVIGAPAWTNPNNPATDPAYISQTIANLWTTIDNGENPAGSEIQQLVVDAVVAWSSVSAYSADFIKFVLESNFDLARDEGFVVPYHVHGHEQHRPRNWMFLQWDNLGLHFSYDGMCTALLYEDGLNASPTVIDQFQFCSPGDVINKPGYVIVIPIPGFGLSIYHGLNALQLDAVYASAVSGVTRGHLVRTPEREDNGLFVHNGGKFRIGIGAVVGRVHHTMGFHTIGYFRDHSAPGVALRGPTYDPGFTPVDMPITNAIVVQASAGTNGSNRRDVVCEARTWNNSGPWTVPQSGTLSTSRDRCVRLHLKLRTSDVRYTPFLQGATLAFAPQFAVRDTTPVSPWKLQRLEFSENEQGRFEGVADCYHKRGDERLIVERGDTTYLVERSDDGGQTWKEQGGGLARLAEPVQIAFDNGGMHYRAKWKLSGMESRFEESHQLLSSSFEGLTLASSANTVLFAGGFEEVAAEDIPLILKQITIPQSTQGQTWKYATRENTNGGEVMRSLFLLARGEFREFYPVYDFVAQKWLFWQRPYDTSAANTFTLTPWMDERNKATKVFPVGDGSKILGSLTPQPPEFNILQTVGLTQPDTGGEQITAQPLFNWGSLTDPLNPDYLGRVIYVKAPFVSVSDANELAKMTLRLADAAGRRRLLLSIPASDYVDELRPNIQLKVRGLDENGQRVDLFDGKKFWLKRRTVVVDYTSAGEVAPQVVYTLDDQWSTEVDK